MRAWRRCRTRFDAAAKDPHLVHTCSKGFGLHVVHAVWKGVSGTAYCVLVCLRPCVLMTISVIPEQGRLTLRRYQQPKPGAHIKGHANGLLVLTVQVLAGSGMHSHCTGLGYLRDTVSRRMHAMQWWWPSQAWCKPGWTVKRANTLNIISLPATVVSPSRRLMPEAVPAPCVSPSTRSDPDRPVCLLCRVGCPSRSRRMSRAACPTVSGRHRSTAPGQPPPEDPSTPSPVPRGDLRHLQAAPLEAVLEDMGETCQLTHTAPQTCCRDWLCWASSAVRLLPHRYKFCCCIGHRRT